MKKSSIVALAVVGGFALNAATVFVMQYRRTAIEIGLGLNPNMSQMLMTKALIPDADTIAKRGLALNGLIVTYMFCAQVGSIAGHGAAVIKHKGMAGLKDDNFREKIKFFHRDRPQPPRQVPPLNSAFEFRY